MALLQPDTAKACRVTHPRRHSTALHSACKRLGHPQSSQGPKGCRLSKVTPTVLVWTAASGSQGVRQRWSGWVTFHLLQLGQRQSYCIRAMGAPCGEYSGLCPVQPRGLHFCLVIQMAIFVKDKQDPIEDKPRHSFKKDRLFLYSDLGRECDLPLINRKNSSY